MNNQEYLDEKNFSIVLGGPFFQILNRVHLAGKSLELVKLRVIVIAMIAWLPLLLFSILTGQAWGDHVKLPFIEDIEVHVRLLITLPLLVAAELVVHQRIQSVVKQFVKRDLVPENAIDQFHRSISSALRLRNSIAAEALMIVIVYLIGYQFVWHQSSAVNASAWYAQSTSTDGGLSMAGIWFRYISLPFFQFLILRWYYRIFIWTRFLFSVSRIKLNLTPTHPDEVGGLGFLTNSINAFLPLAFAHGAILAGMISNHIFFEGDKLLDFKMETAIIVVLVLCIVILPLFSFSPQLAETKRIGNLDFGTFASRYAREFETKWVKKEVSVDNPVMGADIQSLADLANSYKVVENMRALPITRNAVVMLAVVTLIPVLPLVLTMMPIGELIKLFANVVF